MNTARREQRQLHIVARRQRQFDVGPLVDHLADFSRLRLQQRRGRGHIHRLGDRADLQRHVDPRHLVHVERNARNHRRLEPRVGDLQRIVPDRQPRKIENSFPIRRRWPFAIFIRGGHVGGRNRRARSVGNSSGDGRGNLLAERRRN